MSGHGEKDVSGLKTMKLQLNTDFLNQNVLLAVLAAAQVKGETIEVEPVEEGMFSAVNAVHL